MVNIFKLFKKEPNILIIVGGNKAKIEPFLVAAQNLKLKVTIASFSELSYDSMSPFVLKVNGTNVSDFTHIYIRMIGKRLEDASLLVNYAQKYNIKLVDTLYSNSVLMPSSLGKSIEMMKLVDQKVSMPKTFFASVSDLRIHAKEHVGFPCVLKSTTGKKAREVWCPETVKEFNTLLNKLEKEEKAGKLFFAQEFIKASERIRVFVIGNRAVAAIVRPSRWRKRFGVVEGRKVVLNPIPEADARLAVEAAKACQLDIAGVDIIHDDKSGDAYVLEANAAPVWKALSHDTKVNIEEEILKYIVSK